MFPARGGGKNCLKLHCWENSSFPHNCLGLVNIALSLFVQNCHKVQLLSAVVWFPCPDDNCDGGVNSWKTMLLPTVLISQHFCTLPLHVCLPASVETHVAERKLPVAVASGLGSLLLRGCRKGVHTPSNSLQAPVQTKDDGGPSTRQPMGAAV